MTIDPGGGPTELQSAGLESFIMFKRTESHHPIFADNQQPLVDVFLRLFFFFFCTPPLADRQLSVANDNNNNN